MSEEIIKNLYTPDSSFAPKINRNCLRQDSKFLIHKKLVMLYLVCKLE